MYSITVYDDLKTLVIGLNSVISAPICVLATGTLSRRDHAPAQPYFHLTVIRCGLDEKGTISTASVLPFRLVEDALNWKESKSVNIRFEA